MVKNGVESAAEIVNQVRSFIESHPEAEVDYISVCDPDTLEDMDRVIKPLLLAIAVKIGKSRLIDNMILTP